MDPSILVTALQGVVDGVIITDTEGTIQWVNSGFLNMTGYSREEVLGRNPRILKSGAHDEALYSALWKTILSGASWRGELVNRRKDGSLYTAEQSITPVLDAQGRVTHFAGIQRDITARKRVKEELRQSKERYQALIECLGEGILSVDAERRVLMVNPMAESIFGFPQGTLIGKDFLEFVDPADLPMLGSEAERRKRGEKGAYEVRVIRADGDRRTLQVTSTPQLDANGEFQGSMAAIRDVTAEKGLMQRLKLLAHTLDSVDECVSICDPEDRLVFVNRAFLRTYGYEERNLIGEDVAFVRSPLNAPEVTRLILPATLAGGWRGELWNRRSDGTDFLILLNTAVVMDDAGKVEATVGVARDITEQKRAEAELTRARDEAQQANLAKSEFLATMSHEIRTPMNGVIGMTGLLLDTPLTQEQREYAETVRKSGDALLTVINDILDFSKIEAGKLLIECFAFDLRLVIEEVNEMLAQKAEEHDLELTLEYPSGVPQHFVGDAGRIRQVLTNLVGNAIKFTPRGSVRVTVDCLGQNDGEASMRIAVQDTGVGIPAEKLDSLFAKFSQVDSSITRRYGGTGLGLAIAKELTVLMGGSISVESRVGEGSRFWFTLPLSQDGEPEEQADVTGLRGLRALVVDDHEVNRRVVTDMIASWGVRSTCCVSGDEALWELRQAHAGGDPYRFAILDYQMPGMDGATLAAAIKADPALRATVVVMLSSVGQASEVRHLKGASLDACLVKPVRQNQLLTTLAAALGKKLKTDDREQRIAELRAKWAGSMTGLGLRVLVAEDNAVNQKVAVRMLEKLGLRADLASNGREALAMREMLPYDLILMDCQMPEMDGYEAAREIRRRERGARRTAIVAMTAEAMSGARERCIEAGMDDYIAKPVRLDELVSALQKWLVTQAPD